MKQFWREILCALVMGALLPAILFGFAAWLASGLEPVPRISTVSTASTGAEPADQSVSLAVLMEDGTVKQIPLETYITGVILGEMPADFELEAKKAQAVVARTYAIRGSEIGKKHEQAAVCTDPACCQAYCPEEEYLAGGGSAEAVESARLAAESTAGQVLTYQGQLIEATYFSCSGGRTEDALAVWGTDIPYLQATDSPGEENAAHYTDTVSFTAEEFASLLGLPLAGDPSSWLGQPVYTEGGGVAVMDIGGITFQGTTLRQKLGLRSTAFTMTVEDDHTITITTKGFGHRVGMSQYGADAMAVNGSDYKQILSHYYTGTTLELWPGGD